MFQPAARVVSGAALLLLLTSLESFAGSPPFAWPDFDALERRWPGAAAVRLVDDVDAEMTFLGANLGKREHVTSIIAILDPARAGEWLDRTLVTSDWRKIDHIEARTWIAPGKAVDVPRSAIYETAGVPGAVLFADVRTKRFAFPAVTRRTVIELHYQEQARDDFSVEHLFATTIPTVVSRLTLTVPREWLALGFNQVVRAQGLPAEPRKEKKFSFNRGNLDRLTWEMDSLQAVPREVAMPPFAEVSPRISIVPLSPDGAQSDWQGVGQLLWTLYFEPRITANGAVDSCASRLEAGTNSKVEFLRRAAEFVQRDIGDVDLALGLAGFLPHEPREVLSSRRADGKDKVTLLLAILKSGGIAGEPVFVRSASEGPLDTVLVTSDAFDRLIARVVVESLTVWIDPALRECPFGYLPALEQATLALVAGPGGGRIERTPAWPAEQSRIRSTLDAALGADGRLAGTLVLEATGQPALEFREAFASVDDAERRRLAEALLVSRLSGARLSAAASFAADTLDRPFRLELPFERAGAVVRGDSSLVVLPELVWVPRFHDAFETETRAHAVVLDCLRSYEDRVRIRGPEGFAPDGAIEPSSFNGRYFQFTMEGSAEGSAIALERMVANRTLAVPARTYPAARGELDRVREAGEATLARFRRAPHVAGAPASTIPQPVKLRSN